MTTTAKKINAVGLLKILHIDKDDAGGVQRSIDSELRAMRERDAIASQVVVTGDWDGGWTPGEGESTYNEESWPSYTRFYKRHL